MQTTSFDDIIAKYRQADLDRQAQSRARLQEQLDERKLARAFETMQRRLGRQWLECGGPRPTDFYVWCRMYDEAADREDAVRIDRIATKLRSIDPTWWMYVRNTTQDDGVLEVTPTP